MTEHVCSRKYVLSSKGTFHIGILWNRRRWSVFELSAVTVTTTSSNHPGALSKEKTTSRYTLPLFGYQPQSFANGENWDVCYPYEIGGRNLHPQKEPSSWLEGETI